MQVIHANGNFFRQLISPNIKSGKEQSLISGRKSWCSPHVAGWLLVTGVMTDRTQTINQNRPQIHTTFSLKLDFLLSDILFWVFWMTVWIVPFPSVRKVLDELVRRKVSPIPEFVQVVTNYMRVLAPTTVQKGECQKEEKYNHWKLYESCVLNSHKKEQGLPFQSLSFGK